MNVLTFLGTGCGWPTAKRASSSLLLETNGRRYLLDAGEPCTHRLKALGVSCESIDAMFISHGHSDHLAGLPLFIQGSWLEGRTRPLPIYLPGELIAPLKMWLDTVYLPASLIGFPVEYHAWESLPGQRATLEQGGLIVSASPTTHLDGLRALIDPSALDRFRAYSLAFDWPTSGRRLVYSADLGAPDDLTPLLAQPCDLLVCELAHFTPKALFSFLRDQPIQRLCLTHFSPELDSEVDEIRRLGTEMLGGAVPVATMRDADRVEF